VAGAPCHGTNGTMVNSALMITVSLISSHFICYMAYYCSIMSENKPQSSFHSCLVGFYRHSKSPHSSSLFFSHLISNVNIFVTLISFCEEIVNVIVSSSFTLARWALITGTLNILTLLRCYYLISFPHNICKYFRHSHFIYVRKSLSLT